MSTPAAPTQQHPPSQGVFLRVKRRRNATLLPSICVEASESNEDPVQQAIKRVSLQQSTLPPPHQRRRSSLWKKVENQKDLLPPQHKDSKKRSFRIVDAVFDDSVPLQQKNKKRKRLTLVNTSQTAQITDLFPSKLKGYRVLNPLERLVDDSLKMVLSGELSCKEHFDFVLSDERLASSSRKWLQWCNAEGGNLLHACAMWNDVTTAGDVLSRYIGGINDALDAEQRTPFDVAEMSRHAQMSQILEAFGADTTYVYDLYRLDDSVALDHVVDGQDMACELQNGYWDDRGELVVEGVSDGSDAKVDADDDDDSNDEDWAGNDYPEEEGWYESDSEYDEPHFRYRATNFDPAYGL